MFQTGHAGHTFYKDKTGGYLCLDCVSEIKAALSDFLDEEETEVNIEEDFDVLLE